MEAAHFAGVAKLRNVRFQGGWIYADRPDTTKENQWWYPLQAYYDGKKPYQALVEGGNRQSEIARFLRESGAISEERNRSGNWICFRLSEFNRERWLFAFAVELASGLKRPAALPALLLARAEEAATNCLERKPGWYPVIEEIRDALNIPQPKKRTNYFAEWLRQVKAYIPKMSEKALAESAAFYLTRSISERLRNIKVRFECEAAGSAWLSAQCFDNLLNSFYWMLANDLATRRAPCRCAYCERFFFSAKTNVRYCGRRKCKERGRRKVDWERNKKKYNRNRGRKREAERKRRGEHAKAKKA
jgi:hypothetical protein